MKILAARPRWYIDYGNDPELEILFESIPDLSEFRFVKKGNLYYGELGDWCTYFAYTGPGDGYGGHSFEVTMEDGTKEVLKGPFSSSASSVNAIGFGPCVEVVTFKDMESWKRGFTGCVGAIKGPRFVEACKLANVYPLAVMSTKPGPFAWNMGEQQLSAIEGEKSRLVFPADDYPSLNETQTVKFVPSLSPDEVVKPEK